MLMGRKPREEASDLDWYGKGKQIKESLAAFGGQNMNLRMVIICVISH